MKSVQKVYIKWMQIKIKPVFQAVVFSSFSVSMQVTTLHVWPVTRLCLHVCFLWSVAYVQKQYVQDKTQCFFFFFFFPSVWHTCREILIKICEVYTIWPICRYEYLGYGHETMRFACILLVDMLFLQIGCWRHLLVFVYGSYTFISQCLFVVHLH